MVESNLIALDVISAGAAQAALTHIASKFERETGTVINAGFGAVGAMKARVTAHEPADVIVLTAALIDELARDGYVVPGSRCDLGRVGTGVAVRAGTQRPDVRDLRVLRANMLAATRIVCPDPQVATAGKVVMAALDKLGITAQVKKRLKFFPNGKAAMAWLAHSSGALEMGITQVTEIMADQGVTYVGPLPAELQSITTYSAGLSARARHPERAKEFIRRLTGFNAQAVLSAAGFDVGR